MSAHPIPTCTEQPILDDHASTCRRCAVLVAFKIAGDRPVGVSPREFIELVLKVAGWIVGEESA